MCLYIATVRQKGFGLLILFIFVGLFGFSQSLRTRNILLISDTLLLDTSIIIKGSLSINHSQKKLIESQDYSFNYFNNAFINKTIEKGSLLQISYQVVALDLKQKLSHKDVSLIQPEFIITQNPFLYSPTNTSDNFFKQDGLRMNGSISRGLNFGNNQNVVLNSNLNLQLAGKINNDVDVLAAISDENKPIQPEGNTQQLQDFDKVFVQFSKNRNQLTVGDFEMMRPQESYFMNYNKKSRGAQIQSAFDIGKKGILQVNAEAALSRGRFARNIINGIEGNQGPYRLSGANGEQFIIMISGTEAVYLDGQKLKRGEQNDYVIDYNAGSITFMPKRIITQYSRIVVEFQYSDRNYARTVFTSGLAYQQKNYRIYGNYFSEQDDKNQPFQQTLSDSNKLLLASVGNRLNEALAPSEIISKSFSSSRIQYRKIDTLGYTGVYVYTDATYNDTLFYQLNFSFVGEGMGNYLPSANAANGRVFSWVTPINGNKQGSYEPVMLLVAPNKMQMLNMGVDFKLDKNSNVKLEIAQSNYDRNLFSQNDKQNNIGYGLRFAFENLNELQKKQNGFVLKNEVQYEFVDKNFRYVERYRNVEFDRIWSRQLGNQNSSDNGYQEHIMYFKSSFYKPQMLNMSYQLGYYNRAIIYTGVQQSIGLLYDHKNNLLKAEGEWLRTSISASTMQIPQNSLLRYKAEYARVISKFQVGGGIENEQSRFVKNTDSLLSGSFQYIQQSYFIRNIDSQYFKTRISYTQREDYSPMGNEFKSATIGKNINSSMQWIQKNFNRLNIDFTYREFSIKDAAFSKLKPEQTLLTRIEYDYGFLKRVFTANTYFQLGSGNELRRDYQYLEVSVGQGLYVWKDFNGDGKQQLNEFVIASFADRNLANYIRVFLPTTTLVRTNTNQFNQTFNINPAAVWNNAIGWQKFMAKWYNQTALKIDRKTMASGNFDFINPFANTLDTSLISLASLVKNTLFFNRSHSVFGFDINYQDNKTRSYLTNGIESRERNEKGINLRWNFSREWSVNANLNTGYRSLSSQFFSSNNYNYNYNEFKPKLIYQATTNFRASFNYSYFEGFNKDVFGGQKGNISELGAEGRYNITQVGVLSIRYSYYEVNYTGEASGNLAYDMLQGFIVGKNQLWNISLQQRIGQSLQLNINYDGRQSGNSDMIHIGRMEARYLF